MMAARGVGGGGEAAAAGKGNICFDVHWL